VEASLDRLPGELELRAQPLPSAQEWETAKQRASALFEVEVKGPLTWANVRQLAEQVHQKIESGLAAGSKLAEQITSAATRLGVPADQLQSAPRYRTAGAVGQLLQTLHRREPTRCGQQLALARIETSAAAMKKSFASTADVVSALRDVPWTLLDSLGRIADDRQDQARQVLQQLRQALLADEHVTAFALALRDAREEAYGLLAQATWGQTSRSALDAGAAEHTSGSALAGKADQEVCLHAIDQGHQAGLDVPGLAGLVAELTRRLQEDSRLRVEMHWVLRQEGNQP
jgi:hypothetical protein